MPTNSYLKNQLNYKMTKKTYTLNEPRKVAKNKSLIVRTNHSIKTTFFSRLYMSAALVILLATTVLWAVLGAKIQQHNADQLVNPLLFKYAKTFHQAMLPSAHTYLLKWPLFWLIGLLGLSSSTFIWTTVAVVLATVTALTYILYRIERRPLVIGTIYLALASALLLIPTQPYPGGLLPVSMAMITTRNLEYIVYIASLILLVKSKNLRSYTYWLAIGGLTLLFASDKLFVSLSIGGALLALLVYVFVKHWDLATLAMNWLIASVIATVAATAILWLINAERLVHITGQTGASPYSLLHSSVGLGLGIIYGILGLLTNFGANPAVAALEVRHIPHQSLTGLFSFSGPSYVINFAVCVFGLVGMYKLVRPTFNHVTAKPSKKDRLGKAQYLSLLLIWTSLAALVVFIASQHYYAVDSRYLTIVFFAVFIALATFSRTKHWTAAVIILIGCVLTVSIGLGIASSIKNYHASMQVLSQDDNRNALVNHVLVQHPVSTLIGDYWRVVPISLANTAQKVTPLSDCNTMRDVLSSQDWQPNLDTANFAYLLTLNGSQTDYPNCTVKGVIGTYGRPNTSALIAGNYSHPAEQILFYDHGRNYSSPTTQLTSVPATVIPITPEGLPYTSCTTPTLMNFVAHQDDDLLFMNPDILNAINDGDCIRTVYVTAGDAGQSNLYWLNRERGSETAYASMLGLTNAVWVQRIVKLADNHFITVANPRGNSKVSLIFMYLPDGGLKGDGFKASNLESLAKLHSGKIKQIYTVDGQSSYDSNGLVNALESLLQIYQPSKINTQANFISSKFPDHSDHLLVGNFVGQAYSKYEQDKYDNQVIIPINYYIGYPVHDKPQNVTGRDLQAKEAAFFAYAQFDNGVCKTLQQCIKVPTYSSYLTRQYLNNH